MLRPCASPASYVVRAIDGLEWFVCAAHGEPGAPACRWIVRTPFVEWFEARGIPAPSPGERVCNEPIDVDRPQN